MKKGPLSKKDKLFIDSNKTMSIQELSDKLEKSTTLVKEYVDEKKPKGDDMKLFARNKERGVVVMTESASMASDESKKNVNLYSTRKYRNAIHKIKED